MKLLKKTGYMSIGKFSEKNSKILNQKTRR